MRFFSENAAHIGIWHKLTARNGIVLCPNSLGTRPLVQNSGCLFDQTPARHSESNRPLVFCVNLIFGHPNFELT